MITNDGMNWKRGTFRKFYAKMKIRIGGKDAMEIHAGDEFEYDGNILKYGGTEVPQSGVRSAIKNGWATEYEDEINDRVAPYIPDRNVASSTSVNRDLSRVQRESDQMQTDHDDENTVLQVSDRRGEDSGTKILNVGTNRAPARMLTQQDNRRPTMKVSRDLTDEQEGITVGRVRTAAKVKHDVTLSNTSQVVHQIENQGVGNPEFYQGARAQVRSHMTQSEGVSVRTNVGAMDRNAAVNVEASDEGYVVGQVRNSSRGSQEGVTITDTSNIREERAAARAAASRPQPASLPPLPPVEVAIDLNVNPKVRVARRVDPNFPSDWNFSGKLTERMERVKQHGVTPLFLEALYAAEGDQFRKQLEKAFPKQFGG